VRTAFRVQAVVRGKYESKGWVLQHLVYPKNTPVFNGWGFAWFGQKDETFLVFLRSGTGGALTPVTGQDDECFSFIKLPESPLAGMKGQSGRREV
jgi:hypothetical protein